MTQGSTSRRRAAEQLISVGRADELPPGSMKEAIHLGRSIVVANIEGTYVAFQNSCLHYGVKLSDGTLNGDVVTCRWHQWRYCPLTGKVLTEESPYETLTTFTVHVIDGELLVEREPKTRIRPRPECK